MRSDFLREKFDFYHRIRPFLGPFLGMTILGYFVYHLLQGDRGFLALRHVQAKLDQAEKELEALSEEKRLLEHHVSLLKPNSLDLDLLEEQSRNILNFSYPEDIVLLDIPS